MKKFLLSLAVLATSVFGASADELYKLTFGVAANQEPCDQYNQTWTLTQDGQEWSLTGFSNYKNAWTDVRYGTKTASKLSIGEIKSTFAIVGSVNEVILNGYCVKTGTNDKWKSCHVQSSSTVDFAELTNDVAVDKASFSSSASSVTVTLPTPAANQYYRLYIEPDGVSSNNGWFALNYITFNGTAGELPSVEAPTFELTEGEWGEYHLTISCATEGAEIFYTMDGTDPAMEAGGSTQKYTSAISLWGGDFGTIKAIAVKDGQSSLVSTKSYNLPWILSSFADLMMYDEETLNELTDGVGEIEIIVRGDISFVYQNGSYLYLCTDSWGYKSNAMLYGNAGKTYAAGDTFESVKGTFCFYSGQPQIKNYTLSEAVPGGQTIEPQPTDAESAPYALLTSMVNSYLQLQDASISGVSGKGATLTIGETTVPLYNQFNIDNFENGENLTVEGFVSTRKKHDEETDEDMVYAQFYPTSIKGADQKELVAVPVFNLNDGAYTVDTEIVISCETEGATIHYTVNDGETVSEVAPVTIILTEAMTIEAYATMEGMDDSETVTAAYTIKVVGEITGTEALFDFTSADAFAAIECTPEAAYPVEQYATTVVDGTEMVLNGVSFVASKAAASNAPTLYNNGTSLRVYQNNTLTFTMPAAYRINKITFTSTNNTLKIDGLTDGVWTRPEVSTQANEEVAGVVLNVTGTSRIGTMKVEFEKITDGIESVVVEEGAEAVYYNLQGVRVENPANGLYIRVAGKSASKVFVR